MRPRRRREAHCPRRRKPAFPTRAHDPLQRGGDVPGELLLELLLGELLLGELLLGELLLGELLLGELLLGEVLLGEVLLGEVLLGELLVEDELWFDRESLPRELLLELELLSGALLDELEVLESDFCRCDGSRVLELFGVADADRFECFLSLLRRSFAVLEDELVFESAALAADELDGALDVLGLGELEESDGGVFCAMAVPRKPSADAAMIKR